MDHATFENALHQWGETSGKRYFIGLSGLDTFNWTNTMAASADIIITYIILKIQYLKKIVKYNLLKRNPGIKTH